MDDALSYELVYDAANSDFSWWDSIGLGVVLIIIGAVLVLSPTWRSALKRNSSEKSTKIFAYILFAFSIMSTLLIGIGTFTDYNAAKSASSDNTCNVIEGRIENFQPMPHGGGQLETFRIANENFEYSDYWHTGGFNNTASHGGPFSEGLQARICYIPHSGIPSNIIVRLEIAQ